MQDRPDAVEEYEVGRAVIEAMAFRKIRPGSQGDRVLGGALRDLTHEVARRASLV